jgi:hypothetical protein
MNLFSELELSKLSRTKGVRIRLGGNEGSNGQERQPHIGARYNKFCIGNALSNYHRYILVDLIKIL